VPGSKDRVVGRHERSHDRALVLALSDDMPRRMHDDDFIVRERQLSICAAVARFGRV
jgi:hypothetical protein